MGFFEKLFHLKGLRRKWAYFLVNKVYVGTRNFEKKRKALIKIGHEIGEGTRIVGPIECTGTMKIGKACWIGKNLKVNGNGTVTIGDNCDLGPEITFQTGGHEIGDITRRAGDGKIFHQTVGNGVWIGGRSTICNNSRIGDGVVVAGCACVVKDVPANTLVGGVPARVIKNLPVEETNS